MIAAVRAYPGPGCGEPDYTGSKRRLTRRRRIVAEAEWTQGEANPRFVVTSLGCDERKAKYLYEKICCARGDMENRIAGQASTPRSWRAARGL
jgi:Transposase DDE domain group 1